VPAGSVTLRSFAGPALLLLKGAALRHRTHTVAAPAQPHPTEQMHSLGTYNMR
jgi:hypothetical protein